MNYRGNLGCLWLVLLLLPVGGGPLLVGVLRLFLFFAFVVIAGGALGSWWLRRNAVRIYTSTRSDRHNRFVTLLVPLLVRLAELNGELERSEVAAIRTFFQTRLGYADERLLWLRDVIKEARGADISIESLCGQFAAEFGMQERLIVLQVLGQVAQADGHVTPNEKAFIENVAVLLGLAPFVGGFGFESGGYGGHHQGPSPRERIAAALATLGLSEDASAEVIKKAWRKLSIENHPDKVAHLGEEFRNIAEQRMREINAAYETLKDAGMAA